jgi:predicted amidophosphoribosyltransferase
MRWPPTPEQVQTTGDVSRPAARLVQACRICCGPTSRRFAHCFACRAVARLLNLPLSLVLPAHVCSVPGPLYRVLLGYKESPVDEARAHFSARVGDLFGAFFAHHVGCITTALGGGPDLVVPVPSSSRPGRASLERVPGLVEVVHATLGAKARWSPSALQRSGGEIGPMRPNPQAFAVPASMRGVVHGSQVVVLDDIYVSGSRAQSAAAALRLSGATTVLIVPLGRLVRPGRLITHAAFVGSNRTGNGHTARCVMGGTEVGQADVASG